MSDTDNTQSLGQSLGQDTGTQSQPSGPAGLPEPGSDPFGGDFDDEITLIGGKPQTEQPKNRTQPSGSDENNIDFDELLSDTVPTNDGNSQQPAQPVQFQQPNNGNKEEPKKDFRTAIGDYSSQVVDGLFNAEQFAKQLGEADPNAIALTIKSSLEGMYQRVVQDAMLVARKFADDAISSAAKNQQAEFTAREQAQILKSTLAPYPDLKKAQYRPVVQTVYERAMAKGKSPQEAANLVIAYFKKNIPNAIQEPTQAKQTDGSSINDDIWANFR